MLSSRERPNGFVCQPEPFCGLRIGQPVFGGQRLFGGHAPSLADWREATGLPRFWPSLRSQNPDSRQLAFEPATSIGQLVMSNRMDRLPVYDNLWSSAGGAQQPGSLGFAPHTGSQNPLFCQLCNRIGHRES